MMAKGLYPFLLVTLLLGLTPSITPAEVRIPGRVFEMSRYDFKETVSRIKEAIEGHRMIVVFVADQQAMLAMVGVQARGMQTIEFFHPRYGKVIYEKDRRAGIEAPLRIAVVEIDKGTMISYYRPSFIFGKYPKLKRLGEELDRVVGEIVSSVTK